MASSSGDGEGGGDRRYRPNMQGLLQFCMDSTREEDASGTSEQREMDPQSRQWLEEALTGIAGNDLLKQMAECLKVLQYSEVTSERLKALEMLEDICEDLDHAQDLHKIGGFEVLPTLLEDNDEDIKANSCSFIATLVQNNPYCQNEALKQGLLTRLLTLLDKEDSPKVKIKALYAASCLTRDVPEGQAVFVENDGFSVLLRAMQTDEEKLQTKAAFMMRAMCLSNPQFKKVLCDMGMVDQLVVLLQREHTNAHEHLMSALLCLVEGNDVAISECQKPELNLANHLDASRELLVGKEEYREELEYVERLQAILLEANSTNSASVDR